MLEYHRIDTCKGIMLIKMFDVSDSLISKAMSFNNIAIAFIKEKDYGIQLLYVRKWV